MKNIFLITFFSGVLGTGLGGALTCFTKNFKEKRYGFVTCFASGFMLAVVCFDLIPETFKSGGIITLCIGMALGVTVIILINKLIDIANINARKRVKTNTNSSISNIMIKSTKNENNYNKMALLMFFAIAVHNFPEGMAIGSMEFLDNSASLAILIAIHNIPEGCAVAIFLLKGGVSKFKTVILVSLCGIPTIFGGFLGYLIANISPTIISLCLGFASGAMFYVIYEEMNYESYKVLRPKDIAVFNLIGLLTGICIINIL